MYSDHHRNNVHSTIPLVISDIACVGQFVSEQMGTQEDWFCYAAVF